MAILRRRAPVQAGSRTRSPRTAGLRPPGLGFPQGAASRFQHRHQPALLHQREDARAYFVRAKVFEGGGRETTFQLYAKPWEGGSYPCVPFFTTRYFVFFVFSAQAGWCSLFIIAVVVVLVVVGNRA